MAAIRKIAALGKLGDKTKGIESVPSIDITVPEPIGQAEDPLQKAAAQNAVGTLPERIVWKWLEDEHLVFRPQMNFYGGRALRGGAVVDFLVWGLAAVPVVLRIQGAYWHGPLRAGQSATDDQQAIRLRRDGYLVVDLGEDEIYAAVQWDRLGAYIRGELRG